MKEEIGIAVLGTGFARRTQIPAMKSFSDVRFSSVASGSIENAESCAKEFGFAHFTDNWKESVDRDDVDLVLITTPPVYHLEMALFALEHGKHVLCEKPMAMNASETEIMVNAAQDSGLLAVIDHELRLTNGRQLAYQMIRDGRIGKIRHAKYHFRNAARGNSQLPWTWWSSEEKGGGALGAIGSHVIDTFRWFLDAEIEDFDCSLHTHIKERPFEGGMRKVETDDEFLMMIRFGSSDLLVDATGSVSVSLVEGGPYRNRVEFFGTDGAIRVEDDGTLFIADMQNNEWEQIEHDLGGVADGMDSSGWSRGFMVMGRRVIDALKKGQTTFEHAPSFEDGHEIQKILDRAKK